jgi:hypothetical protein
MATLIANNAEAPVNRLTLQPGINTFGRSAGNHHVVAHASVSGRHCEIIVQEQTIRVRDLGSTNGTFIDDKPVQEQLLAHGQRLRLGNVEFLLEAPDVFVPRPGALRVRAAEHAPAVAVIEEPPVAQTAGAVIAAIVPIKPEPPNFYRSFPGAFVYPFERNGIILLVIGAVVFLVLEFLANFSAVMAVITSGYLFAYMQKIVSGSAQGEDEMPDFPDFGDWWSDIILPFLLFAGTFVVTFLPAIVVFFFLKDDMEAPELIAALVIAAIAGAIYFPMALLAVAVSDNFAALSPHIVVPAIIRLIVPYGVTCLVLGALVGIRIGIEFAMKFVDIWVLPSVIVGFVSLYLLAVQMRILGLLFRSYRERLGWLA